MIKPCLSQYVPGTRLLVTSCYSKMVRECKILAYTDPYSDDSQAHTFLKIQWPEGWSGPTIEWIKVHLPVSHDKPAQANEYRVVAVLADPTKPKARYVVEEETKQD